MIPEELPRPKIDLSNVICPAKFQSDKLLEWQAGFGLPRCELRGLDYGKSLKPRLRVGPEIASITPRN